MWFGIISSFLVHSAAILTLVAVGGFDFWTYLTAQIATGAHFVLAHAWRS